MSAETKLNSMLDDYANKYLEGTDDSAEYAKLNQVFNGSPQLYADIIELIKVGDFVRLDNFEGSAGAQYDPDKGIIALRAENFFDDSTHYLTIFQLAHETHHGKTRDEIVAANAIFSNTFNERLRTGGDFEITDIINNIVDNTHRNEAEGMIAGWNAVIDTYKSEGRELSLEEISKAELQVYEKYFFEKEKDQFILKEDITLNPDLTITMPTPMLDKEQMVVAEANIRALENSFSKQLGEEVRLGDDRASSYAETTAAHYIAFACSQHEKMYPTASIDPPKLIIDFSEDTGINMEVEAVQAAGMVITAPDQRCMFYDKAQLEAPLYFEHNKKEPAQVEHERTEGQAPRESFESQKEHTTGIDWDNVPLPKEAGLESQNIEPEKSVLEPEQSTQETAPTEIPLEAEIEKSDAQKILGYTTGNPLVENLLASMHDPDPEAFSKASKELFEIPESQAFMQQGITQAQLEIQQAQELALQREQEEKQHAMQSRGMGMSR